MKSIGKTIGKICVGALAASLVPYRFRWEKETGSFQLGSLLWSVKKTCGRERDNYEFELFPLFGGSSPAAEPEAPVEAEALAAEPAAAEPAAAETAAAETGPAAEPETAPEA